jgi:serine/threonine-protein kinase
VSAVSSFRRRAITPAVEYQVGELVVGRYLVRERVGAGPFGLVYRAEDRQAREDVALRVLWPELTPDDGARLRFLRGATAVRGLRSRYVGGVRDAFLDDLAGVPACVVAGDFLRRPTLAARIVQRLRYEAPFLPVEVGPVVSQLCAGVADLHRAGLLHANLRARNVYFAGDEIRIGDLGVAGALPPPLVASIAAREGRGQVRPDRAPELGAGRAPTQGTDLYALAAIVAEMLGLSGPAAGDGVAPSVRAALGRALSPNPAARFPDADALAAALLTAFERERPHAGPGAAGDVTPALERITERSLPVVEEEPAVVAGAFSVAQPEPLARLRRASREARRQAGSVLDADAIDSRTPVTAQPNLFFPEEPVSRARAAALSVAPPAPAPVPAPTSARVIRVPMWLVVALVASATVLAAAVVYDLIDAHIQAQTAIARVDKARLLTRLKETAAREAPPPPEPACAPAAAASPAPPASHASSSRAQAHPHRKAGGRGGQPGRGAQSGGHGGKPGRQSAHHRKHDGPARGGLDPGFEL